jgi:cobalt-zinc-cadmium efflux system outer membrane protein
MSPRVARGWAGLWLGLALTSGAVAQPTVSLADAVEAAWRRSAQSAEATGQLRQAEARRDAASAFWAAPPAVEAGVMRERQKAGGARVRETELGLAVPLWLPGQRAAGLAQADAAAAAAAASAAAGRLRLAGAVREAAAEVALQRAELLAAEAQWRELDALARDVARRVAAGDLAPADALAARAELLAASGAVAQARQRAQASELQWQALTGLSTLPEAVIMPSSPAPGALDAHPVRRAAALNVELARKRVASAAASRRDAPELLLRARQEVSSGEPDTRGLGIAIRVPFGTADRNGPLAAAALAELDVAEAAEREQVSQLEAALATARLGEQAARQQLADERARAALLRERAGLIDRSFKAGETGLPDMLRALNAAAQAEAALARQEAVLSQATSRLQQALGVMP